MTPEDISRLVKEAQGSVGLAYGDFLVQALTDHMDDVCMRINYYKFLYLLTKEMRPTMMLEIGVEYGLASAHMTYASHSYGGQVIGVDINKHNTPDLLAESYNNYHYIIGASTDPGVWEQVRAIWEDHGPLGVVFQDSSHHYAESCVEWDMYHPFTGPGSVWVCDDITPAFYEEGVDEKSMVEYFDELPGVKMKFPDVLHKGNTMGVVLL